MNIALKHVALALLLPALGLVPTASAEEGWRYGWDATAYGYTNLRQLRSGSVLNPGNSIARLAERGIVGELRANLRAENETLRLTARPILSVRETRNNFGATTDREAYLSQWQLRLRTADAWHIAAGRDLLNWGPAQFRSPSSPFYFNNGRSDPMRELIGMDSLKITWTPDRQTSASLVYIIDTGRTPLTADASKDYWRNGWLAKFDQRGDAWAYGLVAAGSPRHAAFLGAYIQATISDALLMYSEANSSRQLDWLQSPADTGQTFTILRDSPRRTTTLIGAAYTFENGQTLTGEYLHNGHGYDAAQEGGFFTRAQTLPGLALGMRPALLGRDYVHFVWQSNLMDDAGNWRLMLSHNLTDGSSELAAYGERVLNHRTTAFLLTVFPRGNARQEFSTLMESSVTLGLKIALP